MFRPSSVLTLDPPNTSPCLHSTSFISKQRILSETEFSTNHLHDHRFLTAHRIRSELLQSVVLRSRGIQLYPSLCLVASTHHHSHPHTLQQYSFPKHGLYLSPLTSLRKSVFRLNLDGFRSHDVMVVVVLPNPLVTLKISNVLEKDNSHLNLKMADPFKWGIPSPVGHRPHYSLLSYIHLASLIIVMCQTP